MPHHTQDCTPLRRPVIGLLEARDVLHFDDLSLGCVKQEMKLRTDLSESGWPRAVLVRCELVLVHAAGVD